jgi:multimeric flavodoxin WrbA
VAITGSPHRGNSTELTSEIERQLLARGDVEFETIHLKDVDLAPCRGCFVCFMKGEERCPVRDDRETIAAKLDVADGVVLVSPVYSMHVSYLMKGFIDRFGCVLHRPRFHGKYALAIAVAGNIGQKETAQYMSDIAEGWGFDCVDRVGVRAAPRHTTMPSLPNRPGRLEEAVTSFYAAIKGQSPKRLRFRDCLAFRMMQATYRRLECYSPTDYRHWQERGWLDPKARFFHDNIRGGHLLDLPARFLAWMTGLQMDRSLGN